MAAPPVIRMLHHGRAGRSSAPARDGAAVLCTAPPRAACRLDRYRLRYRLAQAKAVEASGPGNWNSV